MLFRDLIVSHIQSKGSPVGGLFVCHEVETFNVDYKGEYRSVPQRPVVFAEQFKEFFFAFV